MRWYLWSNHQWTDGVRRYGHRFAKKSSENICKRMAGMHDGLTDCAALLQENARKGGEKKVHCDNMIKESIELIDELTENK